MDQRSELLEAVGARYRNAAKAERTRILDEFAAVAGYQPPADLKWDGSDARSRPTRTSVTSSSCTTTSAVKVAPP